MGTVKKPYGPWSCEMLQALRDRGLFKLEAFTLWLDEHDIHVDRTLISHWVAGRSHLPADLLPLLAQFTGRPDLIFGHYLREVDCEVSAIPHGAVAAKELTRLMLEVSVSMGRLQSALLDAQAPESPGGEVVTIEERKKLKTHLNALIHQLADLRASFNAPPPRQQSR